MTGNTMIAVFALTIWPYTAWLMSNLYNKFLHPLFDWPILTVAQLMAIELLLIIPMIFSMSFSNTNANRWRHLDKDYLTFGIGIFVWLLMVHAVYGLSYFLFTF